MMLEELPIPGVLLLTNDVRFDDRGSFRRVVDYDQLQEVGARTAVSQVSVATNPLAGTVRGMHYQVSPSEETKTFWCLSGRIFDVVVDIRDDSPTRGEWCSVLLDADVPTALHIPRGVAHGYQTLVDNSSLAYVISTPQVSNRARSLRWDDPTVGIEWPLPVTAISDRDRRAPHWPPPT